MDIDQLKERFPDHWWSRSKVENMLCKFHRIFNSSRSDRLFYDVRLATDPVLSFSPSGTMSLHYPDGDCELLEGSCLSGMAPYGEGMLGMEDLVGLPEMRVSKVMPTESTMRSVWQAPMALRKTSGVFTLDFEIPSPLSPTMHRTSQKYTQRLLG